MRKVGLTEIARAKVLHMTILTIGGVADECRA